MKNILVIGSSSDIVKELLKVIYKKNKDVNFFLVSSNKDINKYFDYNFFKKTNFYYLDYIEPYQKKLNLLISKINVEVDTLIIANGYLPKSNYNAKEFDNNFKINTIFPINVINSFLETNVKKFNSHPTIYFFDSPAGERPRAKNFLYGSSKKALQFYMEGLNLDMNIKCISIKPAPCDTKMTSTIKMKKYVVNIVANSIYRQMLIGNKIIYAPYYWRYIMLIIKLIPNFIFKHLKF